ncbi:MAG: hypothetical protein DRP64_13005, partial [Verrucomicrobia bacterium]
LYNGPRPHAVSKAGDCDYFYDSNGNIIRRDRNNVYEFTANWNSFNKPTSIFSGTEGSEFQYSVDGRRTQQLIFEGTNVVKKVYATPAYEMKEILLNPAETNRANWQWEMDYVRIYVDTPVGKIGIYQQEGNTNGVGTVTRSYMHKDHIGSVVAVSDDSANIVHYSFDAWGNRRDASDWSPLATFDHSTLSTDRGFTGHEQLDHLDLVHMNGRIYDPVIGRMISADPLIQAPDNLQSFNRYSYAWNSPLTNTDPSGFETKTKKATSEAATASTKLNTPIESNELSSKDNIGGNETESSKQVDDYYTDGSGNTQVDQSTKTTTQKTNGNWTEDDKDAAAVAAHVYGEEGAELPPHIAKLTPKQLKEMGLDPSDFIKKNGMAAGLYYNSRTKQHMLAFRGTEGLFSWKGLKDWTANTLQAVGMKSGQYTDAMNLAGSVYSKTKGNLMITGHSLGGGLASAASRATGADAITFNAAGLGRRTIKRGYGMGKASNIRAHRTRAEILTTVQNFTPLANAAGDKTTHKAKHWYSLPFGRHGMKNFEETK